MTTILNLRLYSAGGVALYSPSRVEHLALGLDRCCAATAASDGGGFFPTGFAPGLVALSSGDNFWGNVIDCLITRPDLVG